MSKSIMDYQEKYPKNEEGENLILKSNEDRKSVV